MFSHSFSLSLSLSLLSPVSCLFFLFLVSSVSPPPCLASFAHQFRFAEGIPIIVLPTAVTALLTMINVKDFLEDGV
jgi:hypothetical protein